MKYEDLLRIEDEIHRAFREARAWMRSPAAEPAFTPPTDVSWTEDAYHVRVDIPGVNRQQVRVVARAGALVISGVRGGGSRASAGVVRQERQQGPFWALIPLPSDANLGRMEASLDKGVLSVRIGRLPTRPVGPVEVPVR